MRVHLAKALAWLAWLAVLGVSLTGVTSLPSPLGPRTARADEDDSPRDRALRHFKKGKKLFALGHFAEALKEYEAAYDEVPEPDLLFNIGQCHRNLKHYDEAIFSFQKYLKDDPDAENRDAVEKLIADLEDKRDAEAAANPNGNGNPIGPIPGPGEGEGGSGKPIYKKWWFIAGVVVVGVAAGAYALRSSNSGPPSSSLGNLDFPK